MPPTRRQRWAVPASVGAALAVIIATTLSGHELLGLAGVVASISVATGIVRASSSSSVLSGQAVPYAMGVAVLAVSRGGIAVDTSGQAWRSVVVVAAYPFLAHALLRLVARYQPVREADVVAEAALLGTAVGIALHISLGTAQGAELAQVWGAAAGTIPSMLVGLDVALLVIGMRVLKAKDARRGAPGCIVVGVLLLLTAHVAQQVAPPALGGALEVWLLAIASVLALGVVPLHPAAHREPDQLLTDQPAFSTSHTIIVCSALLAAPGALAVESLRGVQPPPTVAIGAALSGLILTGYLVQLLRDRASTEHDATHDALTRLPNRTLLVDRLDRAIAQARRRNRHVGVLFVDLDRFKEVNDTFGHAAGDELLQGVAGRLEDCVRDEDTVARLAGDEFVVLLPFLADPSEAMMVADRILDSLGEPFDVASERLLVDGSIGIAVFPGDGGSAQEILARADAAMYSAKTTTGSHWEVFSLSLATAAQRRMQLEAGLLDGISRNELVLHYQPIFDTVTGRTIGAEALVRWEHPEEGLLQPGVFVPIAERSDLIVLLGDWVIQEACRELRRWEDLGLCDYSISVNVGARHFARGLVQTVAAALRASGADPHQLVIELTEGTIVDNLEQVAGELAELRQLGVHVAIDDFGTGYCGLRYLSALPVTSLKIDRSFVQDMTPSDAAIVGATVAMGHSLGLTITAEGVETIEQHRVLATLQCDRVQGFLHGLPMPAAELIQRLRRELSRSDEDQIDLWSMALGGPAGPSILGEIAG